MPTMVGSPLTSTAITAKGGNEHVKQWEGLCKTGKAPPTPTPKEKKEKNPTYDMTTSHHSVANVCQDLKLPDIVQIL